MSLRALGQVARTAAQAARTGAVRQVLGVATQAARTGALSHVTRTAGRQAELGLQAAGGPVSFARLISAINSKNPPRSLHANFTKEVVKVEINKAVFKGEEAWKVTVNGCFDATSIVNLRQITGMTIPYSQITGQDDYEIEICFSSKKEAIEFQDAVNKAFNSKVYKLNAKRIAEYEEMSEADLRFKKVPEEIIKAIKGEQQKLGVNPETTVELTKEEIKKMEEQLKKDRENYSSFSAG